MGWESSDMVGFDLGPLLQGQMMVHRHCVGLIVTYQLFLLLCPFCVAEGFITLHIPFMFKAIDPFV